MKIPAGKIDDFIRNLPGNQQFILIYGPDLGQVSERTKRAGKHVVPDLQDPFLTVTLDSEVLKEDPARLHDEVAAISFTGEQRLITVPNAGNTLAPLFKKLLENPTGNGFVIVSAGDLAPSSALRKCFESAKNAAALPCYKDDAQQLRGIIHNALKDKGFNCPPDVVTAIQNRFFGDRQMVLNELEKLTIYMGQEHHITLEDVEAVIGESQESSFDDLCNAVASANFTAIESSMARLVREHIPAVAILRALSRYFLRLQLIRGHIDQGMPVQQAISAIKPPIFFKQVPLVKEQIGRWQAPAIQKVLFHLCETEKQCKQTGMPHETLCHHIVSMIPLMAKSRKA